MYTCEQIRDERQQLFEKLTEEVKKNLKGMSEKLKIIDQNVNEENERKFVFDIFNSFINISNTQW